MDFANERKAIMLRDQGFARGVVAEKVKKCNRPCARALTVVCTRAHVHTKGRTHRLAPPLRISVGIRFYSHTSGLQV